MMGRLRSFRAGRLPLLVLLALGAALGAAVVGPPAAEPARAQAPAAQTVPSDWPLIPDGVGAGESFRLLFVTSSIHHAASSEIADYNAHVQAAANSNPDLAGFSARFRALISTASVDARDNTATTGTGVPVHWLGGAKVADDYADLYDKSWDSVGGTTEAGAGYTGLVWTGGNKAGLKSGKRYAGAAEVRLGDLSDAGLALSSPRAGASSETYPLYALSPVITVAERLKAEGATRIEDGNAPLKPAPRQIQGQTGPTAQTVAADWACIPKDTNNNPRFTAGQSFRLLFVTSTTTQATSTSISTYNGIVTTRAAASDCFTTAQANQFRAFISTTTTSAKSNTATTGTGEPIYWLKGAKVADNYADFFDNSWDSYAAKNESGSRQTGTAWTGTWSDGDSRSDRLPGQTNVNWVNPSSSGDLGVGNSPKASLRRLLAFSPVFTVAGGTDGTESEKDTVEPRGVTLPSAGSSSRVTQWCGQADYPGDDGYNPFDYVCWVKRSDGLKTWFTMPSSVLQSYREGTMSEFDRQVHTSNVRKAANAHHRKQKKCDRLFDFDPNEGSTWHMCMN